MSELRRRGVAGVVAVAAVAAVNTGCGPGRATTGARSAAGDGADGAGAGRASGARPAEKVCAIAGEPVVVRRDGDAVLERWEIEAAPVLFEPVLPVDAAYAAYRAAIREAGAELEHPIADAPVPRDEAERELWRREDRNREVAYSGRAGRIRPIHCLEAWSFARQHARLSELASPTEFMLSVLERRAGVGRRMLRLYFAAGAQMFPPRSVYPFGEIAADVAQGWEFTAMLHNHTIRRRGDRHALGVTSPSASDVQLLRGLAEDLRLRAGWITNGVYTIEIPAAAFDQYVTRD